MKPIRRFSFIQGFTLIETLTAMMILSISLVTIFQLFAGGLRSARFSEEYNRAVFHARAKMESILLFDEMREMELGGELEDGFRWEASVSPFFPETEDRFQTVGSPLQLFSVEVRVIWDSGNRERDFELQTLHIARHLQ
jgi:general secretion pathway protein I